MKITGTFKDYAGLRTAYGADISDELDDEFDSFLKKIAGKDCVLTGYSPLNQTFDTTMWAEDPERPGSGIMTYQHLDGRSRRYGDNMGIDKLDSVIKTNADTYIYCTRCGFTISKDTRYDFEPSFSYGDIYAGNCSSNPGNIVGTTIHFNACKDGLMYCPQDRALTKWDEVGNTLP